jgi:hypothetical protein
VCLPKRIINFQCLRGGGSRLREDFLWGHVAAPGMTQSDI